MLINFDDIGQVCVSFRCDHNTIVGAPCRMIRSRTVDLCENNASFIGKVVSIRNYMANVVVKGFVTFPYSGEAPDVGYVHLVGDGNGGVTASEDGETYLVVGTDATNKTVTILL